MTQGHPLPLILQFMLPVLLGQVVQQTYNMVDAMIVGRALGANALASVGASSSVQFMVLGFCSGMCDGSSIPIAQRFGAGDLHSMRRYIFHLVRIISCIAAGLTLLTALLCPLIIRVLHTPADITSDANLYLLIIFLGLPFTFFYNAQASLLRAVGNSKIPFLFLAISAGLNIFLDLFCVVVLKWGCAGAAIATVTSQALSGFMCLVYIIKKMDVLKPRKEDREWSWISARNILSMGLPMGLQFSITAIGSMVMQAANNGLGSLYVSAYTAANRYEQLIMCPYVALSSSVATYVGQNYGAGKIDRIKAGVRQTFIMGNLYGLVFGSLMAVTGRAAASLFLSGDAGQVLDVSAQFLRIIGFSFWIVTSVNVFRPAMQSMGYPIHAIFSGVMEMAARTIFSIVATPLIGFLAICLVHQVAWITAGIYVICMYRYLMKKIERQNIEN